MRNTFTFYLSLVCSFYISYIRLSNAQTPLLKSQQKISNLEGDFQTVLASYEEFGYSLTSVGDLNGDGITDICVGAIKDDDGGFDKGAVYILFLNSNGTVKDQQKISNLEGGFNGTLDDEDYFGRSLASLGDLNGDGVTDICVGAHKDDDGGTDRGAVWILFLKDDGTVKSYQKISDLEGNFSGQLDDVDLFGASVANIGDLNEDGITDIAVGANLDDDGGNGYGAVWILFMETNGKVKSHQKISKTEGNFSGLLTDGDNFGVSVCGIGDLNQDEHEDIAVGSYDNISGYAEGAVWILFLDQTGQVSSSQKIAEYQGGFTGTIEGQDYFGISLSNLGDINGDSLSDIAAGALFDDDGGLDQGACWLLYLSETGKVKTYQKISSTEGNFLGMLHDEDYFGRSVTAVGDLNADGSPDLCIGASSDDDLNPSSGALWTVFLDTNGIASTVYEFEKEPSVTVYPNPANDYVCIRFDKENLSYDVSILNSLGQQLTIACYAHKDFIQIDLHELPTGCYSLFISNDNFWMTKEIIKQ